jgi:hypothetical protein
VVSSSNPHRSRGAPWTRGWESEPGAHKRTRSAAEERQDDREDRTASVSFEQKLALMPAHDIFLYERANLCLMEVTDYSAPRPVVRH